jgi:hypothetical protein
MSTPLITERDAPVSGKAQIIDVMKKRSAASA